jgi:hypothetical protein
MGPDFVELPVATLFPDSVRVWERQWRDRAALAELETGLRAAIKHRGAGDRKAAVAALETVLRFLYTRPHLTAEGLELPLFDLWIALKNLNKGRVSPILIHVPAGSSPPHGDASRMARGHAIFAVEQLVERWENASLACQAVAKRWNQTIGGDTSNETIQSFAETIRSWYYRSSRLPADDPEREVIAALRQGLESFPEMKAFTKKDILDIFSANLKSLGIATIVERG